MSDGRPMMTEGQMRQTAAQAKRLIGDPLYVDLLREMQEAAAEVMISGETKAQRAAARHEILALRKIHAYLLVAADAPSSFDDARRGHAAHE